MPHLYDPQRHESLCDDPWNPSVVHAAIGAIASEVLQAGEGGLWPTHPLDSDPSHRSRTIYEGSAGVLWGLSALANQGVIADDARISEWACALPDLYASAPDTPSVVPSYFIGEAGVLLVAARAERRAAWLDRLFASVQANIDNPSLEVLWGSAGTALAAAFAHELTGEERWRSVFLANVRALTRSWRRHERKQCDLWTQDLYGRREPLLGAAHGFAGNLLAFFRGFSLLQDDERAALLPRAVATLAATASIDGPFANWPTSPRSASHLVQWCHGAPGVITCFARAPHHERLDSLLAQGGELVWHAGPVRKGASLCHGTAGNGAALLALFARTGDPRWLERARRFAMHAVRQSALARAKHGRRRYNLWTGDVGVAVYLAQCLRPRSGLPSIDF
ncbi:MAG TPA: LanC-like protein [Polyangiaceae bacterium]|nr:LanC-like protein [Polyangiaceae bacterium]